MIGPFLHKKTETWESLSSLEGEWQVRTGDPVFSL